MVAACVCLVFVYFGWALVYGEGLGASFERVSSFARRFSYFWAQLSTLILAGAALVFSASIVVEERAKSRLSLLIVAQVSPGCIVAAKGLSVFARIAVGILVALPLLMMLGVFGGVEPKALIFLTAIVLSNVWLYGSLGLVASVWGRSLLWTIALAFGAAIAWNIALSIARSSGAAGVADYGVILSVPEVTDRMFYVGAGWFSMAGAHVVANMILGTVLLIAAAIVFRYTTATEWHVERERGVAALTASEAKRARRPRATGFGRGVLAKEIVSRRVVFTLLPLILFALTWMTIFLDPPYAVQRSEYLFRNEAQCRILAWETAALLFIIALRAAVLVSSEKERGTVELLLLSRLGRTRILAGKAAAALVEQIPGLFILGLHMVFLLSAWFRYRADLWLFPPAFALATVFSAALGLYFGLAAKHVATAASLTAFAWFFGATLGPAVGAVTRDATAATKVAPVLPALFVCGGLLAAAVVVFFARRGGYGPWLAAASYSIISGGIVLAAHVHFVSAEIDVFQINGLVEKTWMLPVSSLFGFISPWFGVPEIAVISCAQVSLLVWMTFSGLLGFEAQARRE